MDREALERKWRRLSEEVITGMAEWRQAHPKASLREIETALDERLGRVRARMLEDVALASRAADWREAEAREQPVCDDCGALLLVRGKAKRRLQTQGGEEVVLEREYGVCPRCGRGFFPLDGELGLLPGSLTPHLHESLVRLGVWMPFAAAAAMLEALMRARVTEATARRQTQAAGAAWVKVEEQEVERIERQLPLPEPGGDKLLMSVDGAMVPLVRGEWAEAKTLVIGEVAEPVLEGGEEVVHTRKLSYFSRLADADSFSRLALVEAQRRGLESAERVCAVTDGAQWEQGFIDLHRPDAVRILDFPHAAQRLSQVGQALWGEGSCEARQWLDGQAHRLKHEGPKQVLAELRLLSDKHPHMEVLGENLAYLSKREEQMQYPLYQAEGWPIGSGAVESANKLVVEARLKGAGMHWAREHVDAMLGLRNIVCSDRWEEAWPKITAQLQQQVRQSRQERHQRRLVPGTADQPSPPPAAPLSVPQPAPTLAQEQPISQPPQPASKPKQPHRPGPDHPWRHSPIGKAKYLPYRRYPDAKL